MTGRLWALTWAAVAAAAVGALVALNPPLAWAARRLLPLVAALGCMIAFAGLGAPLMRRLLPTAEPADELLGATALGIGLTSTFVFGLGLAGLTGPAWGAAWIATGGVLAATAVRSRWRHLHGRPASDHGLTLLSYVLAVPFLVLVLPAVASPPASTDALEYHLLIPKIWLSWGHIAHIPGLVEASYPSLVEHLYMLVLPLAGDGACKALHFWCGILAAAALARLVARIEPGAHRGLAPALLLAMPVVATIMAWAWNDMLFVFLMVAGLGWIVAVHDQPSDPAAFRRMVLAGILIGLAAWTKYTAVMLLAALAPLFLLGLLRWRWRPRLVLAFALPVALISLAVFLKNLAFTGNPFHPFLYGLFQTPEWTPAADAYFHAALRRWEIPSWSWWTPLVAPYHLIFTPRLIDVHLGVVPLLFAPLAFVGRASRGMVLLRWFLVFHAGAWLLIQTENRSLLTMVAVILAVGSIAFERLWRDHTRLRPALAGVLLAAGAANLTLTAVNHYYLTEPLGYFIGLENRHQFLLREARSQRTFDWLDRQPEPGSVLLVALEGPYHLHRPAYFSSYADPPAVEVLARGATDRADLATRLQTLAVRWVAIDEPRYRQLNDDGLFAWSAAERAAFEALLAEDAVEVARFGDETIYRLP